MLRKVIVLSFIMLFVFTGTCFAFDSKDHIEMIKKMKDVPRIYGGLGGKMTNTDIKDIQNLIDQYGRGGKNHRHNGSHNKKTIFKLNKPLIKFKKWNKWALGNIICIHNIMDMYHWDSKGGTNGWNITPKRQAESKILYEKLLTKKKILRFPKWAKKPGPNMKVTDNYKKFCVENNKKGAVTKPKPKKKLSKISDKLIKTLKLEQTFKKISVVVKRVPYIGPIIYVTYEGVTFTYRIIKKGDINWDEEISNAISTTVGLGLAVAGAKIGFIICSPLEAIPVAGPVLHVVGTAVVSIGCAFSGEYITSKSIQYIKITYI